MIDLVSKILNLILEAIIGQQQARQDVLGTLAGIGQQAGIFNQPTTAYTAPAPTLPAPQFGGISGGAGLRPIPF